MRLTMLKHMPTSRFHSHTRKHTSHVSASTSRPACSSMLRKSVSLVLQTSPCDNIGAIHATAAQIT
eukprot:1156874-Pelagomonas_calceolata.AAC.3